MVCFCQFWTAYMYIKCCPHVCERGFSNAYIYIFMRLLNRTHTHTHIHTHMHTHTHRLWIDKFTSMLKKLHDLERGIARIQYKKCSPAQFCVVIKAFRRYLLSHIFCLSRFSISLALSLSLS